MTKCPVCNSMLKVSKPSWVLSCKNCNYEHCTIPPKINLEKFNLEEELEIEESLEDVRSYNIFEILKDLKGIENLEGLKALDIGCGIGVFLKKCLSENIDITGVEPDKNIYNYLKMQDLPVINDFYPSSLTENTKYDLIFMHDSLEHIPSIEPVLSNIQKNLKKDGFFIVTVPNSDGFLYKLSKVLNKLGYKKPYNRLWQKDFPSPHIHYFNPANLNTLIEGYGFKREYLSTYKGVSSKNLWSRVKDDSNIGLSYLTWAGTRSLCPFLDVLPKDFALQIYTSRSE